MLLLRNLGKSITDIVLIKAVLEIYEVLFIIFKY